MKSEHYLNEYKKTCEKFNACFEKHVRGGVVFLSDYGVFIDDEVEIEQGATILPGTILKGKTKIGANSVIGPNSVLSNASVEQNVIFNASQGYNCIIKDGANIGPFCHIRPDSVIGKNVHLGDFVEIKNSTIGEATSVSHLTYVGDSDVGKGCNFGCGVAVANYDGGGKNRCIVEDFAFIGCNTSLISPVKVGSGAYTAAGSVITKDVPQGALSIARPKQEIKSDWAKNKLGKYIEKQKGKMKDTNEE